MSDLGTRAPTPKRQRLGSSRPITLEPIAKPVDATTTPAPSMTAPAAFTATKEPLYTPTTSKAGGVNRAVPVLSATPPQAVETSSAATVGLTLRLGETLYTRLTQYKEGEGLSYPTAVLVAVQSTYSQLPQLLAARSIQIDNAGPNLFGLPAQVARRSTTATEAKHQLPIKISPERRDVLNQIVDNTGASSLNELVCTALDAFLPGPV